MSLIEVFKAGVKNADSVEALVRSAVGDREGVGARGEVTVESVKLFTRPNADGEDSFVEALREAIQADIVRLAWAAVDVVRAQAHAAGQAARAEAQDILAQIGPVAP